MASGRNFTKVEAKFVKLGDGEDEQKEVEGTLIEKGTMTIRGSVVGRYKLEDDNGVIYTVMGSTSIDDVLEAVPEDTYIKLEFAGTVKTNSGMNMKQVNLYIADN